MPKVQYNFETYWKKVSKGCKKITKSTSYAKKVLIIVRKVLEIVKNQKFDNEV